MESPEGLKRGLVPLVEVLLSGRTERGGFFWFVFPQRVTGEFEARVKSELVEYVVDVTLDRVNGDVQLCRDVFVAPSMGNQIDDALLACGHAHGLDDLLDIALLEGVLDDLREERPR
jgi:hypothetical protein